jgi:hypothetical protein
MTGTGPDTGDGTAEAAEFRGHVARISRDVRFAMYGLAAAGACTISALVLPQPWSWIAWGGCAAAMMTVAAGAMGLAGATRRPEAWVVFLSIACFVAAAFANVFPGEIAGWPSRTVSVAAMVGGVVLLLAGFGLGQLRFMRLEREYDARLAELDAMEGVDDE